MFFFCELGNAIKLQRNEKKNLTTTKNIYFLNVYMAKNGRFVFGGLIITYI